MNRVKQTTCIYLIRNLNRAIIHLNMCYPSLSLVSSSPTLRHVFFIQHGRFRQGGHRKAKGCPTPVLGCNRCLTRATGDRELGWHRRDRQVVQRVVRRSSRQSNSPTTDLVPSTSTLSLDAWPFRQVQKPEIDYHLIQPAYDQSLVYSQAVVGMGVFGVTALL